MRDHDEQPTIIIERGGGGGGVGPFLLGALVGAGLALLFAPQSGAETQAELKAKARKLKASAEDRVRAAQKQLEERLDAARENVQSRVDDVKDAVDAGRKAAVDARGDLERKLERSKAAYRAGIEAARQAAASGGAAAEPDDTEEAGA
ncbi:MAG: YtxH domain-containing protein [Longimicrobiales bacterium]